MDNESEDRLQKMHCLEQELAEASMKSDETVEETRCDSCRQFFEMEEKVYAKYQRAEETRSDIRRQASEILADQKYNMVDVWRLASCKMAENMEEMEENTAEVIQVTCCKMAYMEDRAEDMTCKMR